MIKNWTMCPFTDVDRASLSILPVDTTSDIAAIHVFIQDVFLGLMIMASMRDEQFIGIAAACLQGIQVDTYTAGAALQRAFAVYALPRGEIEECIRNSVSRLRRSK